MCRCSINIISSTSCRKCNSGCNYSFGGAVGTATTIATSTVLGSASAASCGIIAGGTTALNVGITESVIQSAKNINCN